MSLDEPVHTLHRLIRNLDMLRHGKKYMLVLCLSSTLMALGFGIRIPMTNSPDSIGIYIGQYLVRLHTPSFTPLRILTSC